jgi:predicted enzyme related to lactoylglutathione lyase
MKTAKPSTQLLAVFAIVALALGALSATALAGLKKKTAVVYFSGSPKINSKSGKVTVKGAVNTASVCRPGRGMRLQVLDPTGVVIAVLDGATSDLSGNWKVQGQLPAGLAAGSAVRVKATKLTAGKFVCRAGVSVPVPIPAA